MPQIKMVSWNNLFEITIDLYTLILGGHPMELSTDGRFSFFTRFMFPLKKAQFIHFR